MVQFPRQREHGGRGGERMEGPEEEGRITRV